jgi:hypothetical protein
MTDPYGYDIDTFEDGLSNRELPDGELEWQPDEFDEDGFPLEDEFEQAEDDE